MRNNLDLHYSRMPRQLIALFFRFETSCFPHPMIWKNKPGEVLLRPNSFRASYILQLNKRVWAFWISTHIRLGGIPRFSGIDESVSSRNAKYICEKFPPPITHAMIVFNAEVTAHDAVIFDRSLNGFRQIDHLEILGRGIQIRPTGESDKPSQDQDPQYSRQVMIPGWNQTNQARQKVVVVGAGGNGVQVIQTLILMVVGTEGWIAAIDPDIIEESNLSRIAYAYPEHIGVPKVTVAAQYAGRKNPAVRFYPYPCSVTEKVSIDRIKAATVIFGAGDNDAVRKVCNELSIRYGIPYIDLGCDIQVEGNQVAAGRKNALVYPAWSLAISAEHQPAKQPENPAKLPHHRTLGDTCPECHQKSLIP